MLKWIRERIWVKLAMAQLSVVFVIVLIIIVFNVVKQTTVLKDQVTHDAEILAETILYGISESLSKGDNISVLKQFDSIKRKIKDLNLFICSFDGKVVFTSETLAAGRKLAALIHDAAPKDALDRMEKMIWHHLRHSKRRLTENSI